MVGLLALATSGCGDRPVEPSAPSVLVVSIDTLRADVLGAAGGAARTPVLDRLARAGSYVPRARSHVPLTLPSHATLLTGQLPPSLGLHDNAPFALPDTVPTLATRLSAEQYWTAAVIGGAPLARGCGLESGFEQYLDPPRHRGSGVLFDEQTATAVTDQALEILTRSSAGPGFLFLHYFDPHRPYAPPAEFQGAATDSRERYLGEVGYVDHELGRVVQAIEAQASRWLLVVTADHGEGLGDHGEATHGYQVFDTTLEVPLILAEWDGHRWQPWNEVDPAQGAQLIDVTPTLLARLGLEPPAQCQGRDLATVREPRAAYVESLAASLQFGWAQVIGVRTTDGLFVQAGAYEPTTIPGLSTESPGAPGEWWIPRPTATATPDSSPSRSEPPGPAELDRLRALLDGQRRVRPLPREGQRSALAALGYLSPPSDPGRHDLTDAELNATRPSPLARLGWIQQIIEAIERLQGGDPDLAGRILKDLVLRDPDNATAHYYLARALLDQARRHKDAGLAEAAAHELAETLRLEPTHPAAAVLRLQALGLAGDFVTAIRAAEEHQRRHPSAASEHLLGALLAEPTSLDGRRQNPRFDLEQATHHLLNALQLDPTDAALRAQVERLLDGLADRSPAPSWLASARSRLEALIP